MTQNTDSNLIDELIIPLILFVTASAFGFAIRGTAGFGAVPGCVFFGLLVAMVWFLLSREPTEKKTRRYNMGWCVIALILGLGVAGSQGWMQWPAWVGGKFYIDYTTGKFIDVNPVWGFTYVFLAGVHWVGIGAIFLAWTGSKTPLKPKDWMVRILFGVIGAIIGYVIILVFPQLVLPNYDRVNYSDCPQCVRIIGDVRLILIWTGLYLGLFAYEIYRKDWLNVKLIVVISVVTGLLWMVFMYTWQVAVPRALPDVTFNWWRCWETSGGIGIGVGLGVGYYLCNKKLSDDDPLQRNMQTSKYRNGERLIGVYFAITIALAWSMMNGIKGWLHIYLPEYPELDVTLIGYALPIAIMAISIWLLIVYKTMKDPYQFNDGKDNVPEFSQVFVIVYFIHRIIGLEVTWAPYFDVSEITFFIYYLILAGIDLLVLTYWVKRNDPDAIGRFKNYFRFNFGLNIEDEKKDEKR